MCGFLSSGCDCGYPQGHNMEDLAQKWKTLSLSKVEDTTVDLSRGKKKIIFCVSF